MRVGPIFSSLLTVTVAAVVPDQKLLLLNGLTSSVAPYEQYIKSNVSALGSNPSTQQASVARAAVIQSLQTISAMSNSTFAGLQKLPASTPTTTHDKVALTNYANGVKSAANAASSLSTGPADDLGAIIVRLIELIEDYTLLVILEPLDPGV